MSINRKRVIAYGVIFCMILISAFVIWPAEEVEGNGANINPSLCKGSNLDIFDDSCIVVPDEPQKFYFGGFRYLEQIYGFSSTISNDKEQFPLLKAALGSLALALSLTLLALFIDQIIHKRTNFKFRKPTSREIIVMLIIFTMLVFIVSQYILHKVDNTKPYGDTGCDPVTGLC